MKEHNFGPKDSGNDAEAQRLLGTVVYRQKGRVIKFAGETPAEAAERIRGERRQEWLPNTLPSSTSFVTLPLQYILYSLNRLRNKPQ
ncbi:MAG TPA: hypothetical protein VNW29_07925 [Candidatus Sulfotelmatobacter sp.]|jgi:hypothetical protein|nr:hypothetical protein [Candidatus Sulfotelmatobacter sp.]